MTRHLDLQGLTPSSDTPLALAYARSVGARYDVVGVELPNVHPGDTIVTGPWGDWGWLPGESSVEVLPDNTEVARESTLVHALHTRGLSVGYRNKPPKTAKSRDYVAYHEALQWVDEVTTALSSGVAPMATHAPYTVVTDPWEAQRVIRGLHGAPYAWDVETDGLDPRRIQRIGIALANAHHAWWITDIATTQATLWELVQLLRDPLSEQRGSNLKFDSKVIWGVAQRYGWETPIWPLSFSFMWDTQIMVWLLQAGGQHTYSNDLKSITKRYLGIDVLALADVGGPLPFWEQPYETQALYAAAGDARNSYDLVDYLRPLLDAAGLLDLYIDVEAPVIPVLAEMEIEGLHINRERLMEVTRDFLQWEHDVKTELYSLGFTGSLSNDNHIAGFLYDTLGLPVLLRTEKLNRGSVAVPVLQKLYLLRDSDPDVAAHHRVVELFMEGSEVDKALNTFCVPLLDTGGHVLYKGFGQTSTVTGRLAGPTMQVPGHGRRSVLREVYDAGDGYVLHDADFGQIEPRLGAHYSLDPSMLRDFREGRDVYMSLGRDIGLDITDKHDPRRQNLKTIYLADMYIVRPPQIQAIALRQGTYIPLSIAAEYQKGIHEVRPGFFEWRDNLIDTARYRKEVRDLFGRRRLSADLLAIDPGRRGGAERETSNFPEQAGAGGILKLAMPGVQRLARSAGGSLINAVHDELVCRTLDMTNSQRVEFRHEMDNAMTSVTTLEVPLVVESSSGYTWKEAKA